MAILTSILAVFDELITWMIGAVTDIMPIFYGTDGLTYIGVLTTCGLGIACVLLVLNIVRNFMHFR